MMIKGDIRVSHEICASGGFGDIRSGMYEGVLVAVKTAKVRPHANLEKMRKVSVDGTLAFNLGVALIVLPQRFYREVVLWGTLSHPNVLKLVGVQEDMKKMELITVSEWMMHGTIMDYIGNNYTNRLELVCGFTFPALPSLKCDNSCMGQPRA